MKSSKAFFALSILFTLLISPKIFCAEPKPETELGLQSIISKVKKTFKLNKVTEQFLAHETSLVKALQNQFEQNQHNPVRFKLAQKWTRNAATRIFFDYRRSFLELIVNACDAMLPKQNSVGKFGMGFFSIFSFLTHQETNGTTITVRTTTRKSDGCLFTYEMKFEKDVDNDIQVSIYNPNVKTIGETGTKIFIEPKNNEFSLETLEELRKYAHYMEFYPSVKINVYDKNHTLTETIGISSNNKSISVLLKPDFISVHDSGSGIPLNIAFTKLLVPSSSTKSEQDFSVLKQQALNDKNIHPISYVEFNGKEDNQHSHFLITINNVIVINKKLHNKIVDQQGRVKDILLKMPQITQLTISRDEIMFPETEGFEQKYLKLVIAKTITNVLQKNDTTAHLLHGLYQGLEEWENQTSANHIKGYFTAFFKKTVNNFFNKNPYIFPVPMSNAYDLKKIAHYLNPTRQTKLINVSDDLVNCDYSKLENYFYKTMLANTSRNKQPLIVHALQGKLIAGLNVYFVPDNILPQTQMNKPIVSRLGLRTSLFVPQSYLQNNDNISSIASEIIQHCTELSLQKHSLSDEAKTKTTSMNNLYVCRKYQAHSDIDAIISGPVIAPCIYHIREDQEIIKDRTVTQPPYRVWWPSNLPKLFSEKDVPILKQFFKQHEKILSSTIVSNVFRSSQNHFRTYRPGSIYTPEQLAHEIIAENNIEKVWDNQNDLLLYDNQDNTFYSFPFSLGKIQHPVNQTFIGNVKAILNLDDKHPTEQKKNLIEQQIKSFLENKHKHKLYIKKHSLLEVMNFYFGCLLKSFDRSLTNSTTPYVYYNNENLFPQKQLTYSALEKLFLLLTCTAHNIAPDIVRPTDDTNLSPRMRSQLSRYQLKQQDNDLKLLNEIKKMNQDKYGAASGAPYLIALSGIQDFESVRKNLEANLASATHTSKTLSKAIPHIPLIHTTAKIGNLFALCRHTTSPLKNLESIAKLEHIILSHYDKYFNIPDNEFPRTYGQKPRILECYAADYCSAEDIYHFLIAAYTTNPAIVEKLINLQIVDLTIKTESKQRLKDLQEHYIFIPNILSSNPLATCALLMVKKVNLNIILNLIKISATPEHFMFLSHILLQEQLIKMMHKLGTNNKHCTILNRKISNIMKNYIQDKLDPIEIKKSYVSSRTIGNLSFRLASIKRNFNSAKLITQALINITKDIEQHQSSLINTTPFMKESIDQAIKQAQPFTLKQLIHAHCSKSGITKALTHNTLKEIIETSAQQPKQLDIGKINQSVEAGSEKKPIEGSITETLQNSIDAIKEYHNNRSQGDQTAQNSLQQRVKPYNNINHVLDDISTVRYKLETTPALNQNKQHIKLTIRDHIGMPSLSVLLTNFILPDYSGKSQQLGNIGDMGNGTFKLYQAARHVSILTRPLNNQERCYLLHITPIKDPDSNLVIDLKLKILDVTPLIPAQFFGTSMKILFNEQDTNSIESELMYTKDFLINCAGSTHITNQYNDLKINVVLEKGKISSKKTAIDDDSLILNNDKKSNETFVCEYKKNNTLQNKPLFTVYKRSEQLLQSYVTTGGVPFTPLSSMVKFMHLLPTNMIDFLSHGYILDIDASTYEPVQSRTRLQMTQDMISALKKTLLEACYLHIIELGSKKEEILNSYFPHFSSQVTDLYQLSLSKTAHNQMQQEITNFITSKNKSVQFNLKNFCTSYHSTTFATSFYDKINLIKNNWNTFEQERKYYWAQAQDRCIQKMLAITQSEHYQSSPETYQEQATLNQIDYELQNIIHYINVTDWQQKKEVFIRNFRKNDENHRFGLLKTVVNPWFINKIRSCKINTSSIEHEAEKIRRTFLKDPSNPSQLLKSHEEIKRAKNINQNLNDIFKRKENITKLKNILNKMLELFTRLVLKLGQNQHNIKQKHLSIIAQWVYNKEEQASGWYAESANKISMNFTSTSFSNQVELLSCILNADPIQNLMDNQGFTNFYQSARGSTPTLIHEIEHARRNNAHTHGTHTQAIGANGEYMQFDACAATYEKAARENGLLQHWVQQVTLIVEQEAPFLKALLTPAAISRLKTMETTDKKLFMENLGYLI